MNYYKDLPQYISNSQLGDHWDAMNGIEKNYEKLMPIFQFGNLVDAMETEPHKLIAQDLCMIEESSEEPVYFTQQQWSKAEFMSQCLNEDPIYQLIKKHALPQHVYLRKRFPFTHNGDTVHMPVRCKFDFLNKKLKVALDVKTTACTSQKSFADSMAHLKYFRQGAFYMDIAQVDKMWYFGIGKKMANGRYPVFKFAIARGDENYLQGYNDYNKLGWYYNLLIL